MLRRELGLFGAMMMGLGSIIGTGVFVSIGVGAGATGPSLLLAILVAGLLAAANALSSAALAASHAVSGGTYEYGHRYLTPWLGFTAGWMFLCAKTASAATAALGFAGYLLHLLDAGSGLLVPVALASTAFFTVLVLSGLRRSNRANMVIVGITLAGLALFALAGLLGFGPDTVDSLTPLLPSPDGGGLSGFFYAVALMFVAYTGYARIATLGEEVKEPKHTIPRAIIATLAVSALLYVLVAAAALGTLGAEGLARATADGATPLGAAARSLRWPGLETLVAVAAMTAMLGVQLNLIIGLSRVVLAMGRRGDLPPLFARLTRGGDAPAPAIVAVGVAICGLALLGSIETAWAFSAFTVLVYYGVTNLAALRLAPGDRRYPRWVAAAGLGGCLFLAFWVPPAIWLAGLAILLAGGAWHLLARRLWGSSPDHAAIHQ